MNPSTNDDEFTARTDELLALSTDELEDAMDVMRRVPFQDFTTREWNLYFCAGVYLGHNLAIRKMEEKGEEKLQELVNELQEKYDTEGGWGNFTCDEIDTLSEAQLALKNLEIRREES